MPFEQVLEEIYAPLIGRTALRQTVGPAAVDKTSLLTLSTKTDLTKSEAIMALEAMEQSNQWSEYWKIALAQRN